MFSIKYGFGGIFCGIAISSAVGGGMAINNHVNRTVGYELKNSGFRLANTDSEWRSQAQNYWLTSYGNGPTENKDKFLGEQTNGQNTVEELKNKCSLTMTTKYKDVSKNTFEDVKRYCKRLRTFGERSQSFESDWRSTSVSEMISTLYGSPSPALNSRYQNQDNFWKKDQFNFLMSYCAALFNKLGNVPNMQPTGIQPNALDSIPIYKEHYYERYCQQ